MEKKGFTLIELLAVIVVLAIIALIATPIVMNVIKTAQKGAIERSAERYVSAVELAIATEQLENGLIPDGTYTADGNGNLVLGKDKLKVEVNGDEPISGSKIAIKDGQVTSIRTNMIIGDYFVTIDDRGKATAIEKSELVTSTLCTAIAPTAQPLWVIENNAMESKVVGNKATEANPYALGAVYSCDLGDGARTFYVLKEDGNNVKLIMNENMGEMVAWCETGALNTCLGDKAKSYLAIQTSDWLKLSLAGGTLDLPAAQDIADAIGDTEWTASNYTGKIGLDWIKVSLDGGLYNYDPDNPPPHQLYWTATPHGMDSEKTWVVDPLGTLNDGPMNVSNQVGVRPVITISQANMSL